MKRQDRQLEMECLLTKYKESDQTVRSFCEEHGLQESVFYYWQRKRLHEQQTSSTEGSAVFTELRLSKAMAPVELHLPHGLTIGLSGLAPRQLSVLLLELDACYDTGNPRASQDA